MVTPAPAELWGGPHDGLRVQVPAGAGVYVAAWCTGDADGLQDLEWEQVVYRRVDGVVRYDAAAGLSMHLFALAGSAPT